jgi:hypothetical protein
VAVPAVALATIKKDPNFLGHNNVSLGSSVSDSGVVSPLIIGKTARTLASVQSYVAELSLIVIKAAGIAALYASDEESRIAIAASFATVKLAKNAFSMVGSLLIPERGARDNNQEVVISVNLSPLHKLLEQYEINFDVDSIVEGTGLQGLVLAARETAKAAIIAAKAANICVENATGSHSAVKLAEAVANTSAKAARLNRAALEASSSFL